MNIYLLFTPFVKAIVTTAMWCLLLFMSILYAKSVRRWASFYIVFGLMCVLPVNVYVVIVNYTFLVRSPSFKSILDSCADSFIFNTYFVIANLEPYLYIMKSFELIGETICIIALTIILMNINLGSKSIYD